MPAVMSKKGIAMIVPIHMNHIEKKEFYEAARTIRDVTYEVKEKLDI